MPVALTIAGSDPTGGAGLEADLRVFHQFGVHGCAVATALTEQDSRAVYALGLLEPKLVSRRLGRLLDDIRPDAVKIGMLGTGSIARVVADALEPLDGVAIVIDPVIRSSSGAELLDPAGVAVLRERLLPLARVMTPNRAEAAWLLGESEEAATAPGDVARGLARLTSATIVVTGGDTSEPESIDVVHDQGRQTLLVETRHPGESPHGTGCAFSSAIAAGLARGDPIDEVLATAKRFITESIRTARRWGRDDEGRPILGAPGVEHE